MDDSYKKLNKRKKKDILLIKNINNYFPKKLKISYSSKKKKKIQQINYKKVHLNKIKKFRKFL
jgi:hypothetical protein